MSRMSRQQASFVVALFRARYGAVSWHVAMARAEFAEASGDDAGAARWYALVDVLRPPPSRHSHLGPAAVFRGAA